jgi:small subunit ribosomal protein S6
MRTYELLYIIDGGKTEAESATVTDEAGAKLLALGGKAKEQNVLGRKRLAYPIGKQDHGWYVLLHFEIDPAKTNELVKQLNVLGGIVRTVLVAAEEVPKPGEIVQTPTAVEESKETAKVTVPEELRKTAKATASKPEPVAEATPATETTDEVPAKKPAAKKKASAKDLDAALAEQLKDS